MLHSTEAWVIGQDIQQCALSQLGTIPENSFAWLIVPRTELLDNIAIIEQLTQTKLNEQHIKDATNSEHPSFFDSTSQYEMIVFRGIAGSHFEMDIPRVSLTPVSIACFNFDKILLTIYDQEDVTVNRVKDFLLRTSYHGTNMNNPSELLYKILHSVIEQSLALRNPFSQQLSEWQQLMLDQSSRFQAWNEFMAFKSVVEQLAGLCEDQEDAIEDWQQYSRHIQQQQFNINLNDLSDHVERSIRNIQKISDGLDMLIQLHFSAMSHRNNEVLRVLAIISCVFLPLTLITGVFGMNFQNMPILHEAHAYYWTIGTMFALAIILLLLFKWRRWL